MTQKGIGGFLLGNALEKIKLVSQKKLLKAAQNYFDSMTLQLIGKERVLARLSQIQ